MKVTALKLRIEITNNMSTDIKVKHGFSSAAEALRIAGRVIKSVWTFAVKSEGDDGSVTAFMNKAARDAEVKNPNKIITISPVGEGEIAINHDSNWIIVNAIQVEMRASMPL